MSPVNILYINIYIHFRFNSLNNEFISNLVSSFFNAMYQKADPSGVLFLSVSLLLYYTIFVFQKSHTLLHTFNLPVFLFSFFLLLIKLFCNVISWTCQIFYMLYPFNLAFFSGVCFFIYIFTIFSSNSFKHAIWMHIDKSKTLIWNRPCFWGYYCIIQEVY